MMADCAAMGVDVVTYLFNYLAEGLKHGHSGMSSKQLRLHRLYLELIPPFISVAILVAVTVQALRQAIETLLEPPSKESEPDLSIMVLFSGLNLLLDVVNVGCFARVDQAIGIPGGYGHVHNAELGPEPTEATRLVYDDTDREDSDSLASSAVGIANLNMCSAWTHVCADTMRSIAVLTAAGFASLFPLLLSPAKADSWGAILVSVIILVSLGPQMQGLYLTALKIQAIWGGHDHHHDGKSFNNLAPEESIGH